MANIFLGKVMFGYREEQNVVVTAKRDAAYETDSEELARKYAALPPVEDSDDSSD